jgi:MOSC domain-containing protein YiiM
VKLVSVNTGLPREVDWHGRRVRTSIWKGPVNGRVRVRPLNLDGDQQSDLEVHGGLDKAVYIYPSEYYAYWRRELPAQDLAWGGFGENFTTEGLLDAHVKVGDRFRIGSATFMVTQPRVPCYKLGIRFGNDRMVKRFLLSGRMGFYVSVVTEGDVAAGDPIALTRQDDEGVTIADITSLYVRDRHNPDLLRRAIAAPALPQHWKDFFARRER